MSDTNEITILIDHDTVIEALQAQFPDIPDDACLYIALAEPDDEHDRTGPWEISEDGKEAVLERWGRGTLNVQWKEPTEKTEGEKPDPA